MRQCLHMKGFRLTCFTHTRQRVAFSFSSSTKLPTCSRGLRMRVLQNMHLLTVGYCVPSCKACTRHGARDTGSFNSLHGPAILSCGFTSVAAALTVVKFEVILAIEYCNFVPLVNRLYCDDLYFVADRSSEPGICLTIMVSKTSRSKE
jgi:hypothetical protein